MISAVIRGHEYLPDGRVRVIADVIRPSLAQAFDPHAEPDILATVTEVVSLLALIKYPMGATMAVRMVLDPHAGQEH